jgi:hypothetical protein
MVKSRRLKCAGHVARLGRYTEFGKCSFEGYGRIILRWILERYVVRIGGKCNKLRIFPVAGFGFCALNLWVLVQ